MKYFEMELSFVLLLFFILLIQRHCSGLSSRLSYDDELWESGEHDNLSHHPNRRRRRQYEDESSSTTLPPRPVAKLSEREIIQKVLLNNEYDWRVRPVGMNASYGDTGGPVKVTVNIYLRSISKIDDVNMEYSAQFTFRETWIDRRLAYERMKDATNSLPAFIVLALSDSSQQIWMPDTFFQNEKEARKHMIDKPNVLIRIYPNGEILYSVRLSMVLSCPMSLEYYPLDEQKCLIELASYAYTTDDIVYEWKNDKPVQQKDGLGKSLPSFELQAVKTGYCTSTTNTGQYSCLRTELLLRREFSYYLLQLYIPSFMLVIVSWVSFWLDKDSVPARVTLGVTTLLTMTTQSSGINAKLPPVSYTKAIDVWIGVCLAFIFGALLEFALVNYAARKDIMSSVSGALRRGRRPGISSGATPTRDPSLESLNDTRERPQPVTMDSPYNYNTFITNPLLKSPASSFHPQRVLPAPSPGRTMSNMIIRHDQYSPYQYQHNSIRTTPFTTPSNRTGSNGRLPPEQSYSHASSSHKDTVSHSRPHRRPQRSFMDLWLSKYKERSKRIDVVSRLVFPVGFFVFNCVYWTVYML